LLKIFNALGRILVNGENEWIAVKTKGRALWGGMPYRIRIVPALRLFLFAHPKRFFRAYNKLSQLNQRNQFPSEGNMKSARYSKFLAGLVTSLDELEVEYFPIIRRLTMSLKTLTWRIFLLGLLVLLTMSQAGTVSAGNNVWTSHGPDGGMINALAIDPTTPSTLYAGTWGGGVFKSADGGASWSAVNTGLTNTHIRALAIDPATPSTLYAGTYAYGGGVFKSTNGGTSWSAANNGLTNTDVFALVIDPQTPSTL